VSKKLNCYILVADCPIWLKLCAVTHERPWRTAPVNLRAGNSIPLLMSVFKFCFAGISSPSIKIFSPKFVCAKTMGPPTCGVVQICFPRKLQMADGNFYITQPRIVQFRSNFARWQIWRCPGIRSSKVNTHDKSVPLAKKPAVILSPHKSLPFTKVPRLSACPITFRFPPGTPIAGRALASHGLEWQFRFIATLLV